MVPRDTRSIVDKLAVLWFTIKRLKTNGLWDSCICSEKDIRAFCIISCRAKPGHITPTGSKLIRESPVKLRYTVERKLGDECDTSASPTCQPHMRPTSWSAWLIVVRSRTPGLPAVPERATLLRLWQHGPPAAHPPPPPPLSTNQLPSQSYIASVFALQIWGVVCVCVSSG